MREAKIKVQKLTRGLSCNGCDADPGERKMMLFVDVRSIGIRLCMKCTKELLEKTRRKKLPKDVAAMFAPEPPHFFLP
jgi:hypothetical protein